ncbi:hypothetical protein Ocin01_11251 [Orchesella cincta]|uniref:Uncharacterized protein n=1 Tax=Orchesella cincta TaxID=48709 RepID=A0A1D2MR82_ORCCI|nr:hypothetical protein Ocin01_11251 [Orchesella cincta]
MPTLTSIRNNEDMDEDSDMRGLLASQAEISQDCVPDSSDSVNNPISTAATMGELLKPSEAGEPPDTNVAGQSSNESDADSDEEKVSVSYFSLVS